MKRFLTHFSLAALTLLLAAAPAFDQATAQLSGTVREFGRITTQAGDPRIMQFGIKYDV